MTDDERETRRHRDEVRWCIRMGREWFDDWCERNAERRSPEAWRRLRQDVKQQARLGNTGAAGEWKDETP